MVRFYKWWGVVTVLLLSACGGGGGGGGGGSSSTTTTTTVSGCTFTATAEVDASDNNTHPTDAEAARFLQQASFGPSRASIDALKKGSALTWITRQFEQPRASHLSCVDQEAARLASIGTATIDQSHFLQSWWGQALTGRDQLRQRVAFALSQILVVSFNGDLGSDIRGVSYYYDLLEKNAFGNYRDLLEDVTLSPAMGVYLSHLRNRKEDTASGRTPDENYAREIMQLFSIGLYQLNNDGSLKLSGGKPIDTYSNSDISGLAKVFTGYSYGGADTADARFWGNVKDANYNVMPMQGYPQFHSISAKQFLGVTIPAQSAATAASMASDLKTALDTIFNHANVGPFIGKQLIQRLVKSNPSAAYVDRVATAFNTGVTALAPGLGTGKRGDMRATIAAILLDPEARPATLTAGEGKIVEPVIRLANWARAFNVVSNSGAYKVGNTDSASGSLNQTPMRASSVFNFYRPGYVPSNSRVASNSLVAPEMQLASETSVAGYINVMQGIVQNGVGTSTAGVRDVQPNYSSEIALASDSAALLNRIDVLLTRGAMKALTRTSIKTAVDAVSIPTGSTSSASSAAAVALKQRVWLAVFLTMASPDYLVQK
ncbi:DUF1800 domain-containing protein [Uliginosibacterium sediminicola]|uniref:DUF1800 domain-containing protein n=1 Tax=Uliginosibacterium sediminicola TaxID=2024550 RepID=A0ABU9YXB9_9RHOO